MHTQSYDLALAALGYWARAATQEGGAQPPVGGAAELLRRTAWLTCGKAAPSDGEWPASLAGPLASIFSRVGPTTGQEAPAWLRSDSLRLHEEVLFPIADAAEVQAGD